MDKYAVDIDQVLNDFEYSELTDQYNNSVRNAPGTTASSLSLNNVTKHSINNVFHSLNEYLNTNINVDTVTPVDNNPLLEHKENYTGDVNTINLSKKKYKDEETSINDRILKTDTLLDFNGHVSPNIIVNVEDTKLFDGKSDTVDFDRDINVSNEDVCTGNVTEENTSDPVQNYEKKFEVEEKGKTEVYINGSDDIQDSEEVGNEIVTDLVALDSPVKENAPIPADSASLDTQVAENAPILEEIVNTSDNTEDFVEEIKNEQAKVVEIVGFNSDVELDESEVSRLLEDLESEDLGIPEEKKSHVDDLSQNNALGGNIEVTPADVREMADEQDEEVASHPTLSLKTETESREDEPIESETLDNKNVVDRDNKASVLNSEDSSALDNAEVASTTRELPREAVPEITEQETMVEHENIESDDKNEEPELKSFEHNVEEKRGGDLDVKVSEIQKAGIEKECSVDSFSRPQNLPLNGEGDQTKRKIDLIGEPGSTPYNNVYINKEIPKNKTKTYDSDTDYSSSSSPTFSDASSTTSTISADELHNENRAYTKSAATDISEDFKQAQKASADRTAEQIAKETVTPTENKNLSTLTGQEVRPTSEHPTPDASNTSDSKTSSSGDVFVAETVPLQPSSSGTCVEVSNIEAGQATVEEGAVAATVPVEESVGEGNIEKQWLGKEAPHWVPDSDAMSCLHCDMKFTVLKRRHHCRACGLVLCSKCCHLRFRLEYLDADARVCNKCHDILNKDTVSNSSSDLSPEGGNSPAHRPNPNNPLEYCSTVSPLQQVTSTNPNPPAVMVPVGVLKRKGSNKAKSNKSVMFCDGIKPGSDLTNLDNDFNYNNTKTKKLEKTNVAPVKPKRNLPTVDPETNTFIPSSEHSLPPTVVTMKTDISYTECENNPATVEILKKEQLTFALLLNLHVHLKIVDMNCCINKKAWCFATEGLINVGQDEIVILLEYIEDESFVPKDVFYHINNVYNDAVKGTSVKEMGLSLHNTSNFLDSKNHAGFVYVRPTFQCLENIIKPKEPYLIGILIHRWETPWAKLFPLRLILRLGAEYRYYPSPIISTRHRESVFVEIGHTIINLLADFRNFSYTLPQIRGLTIHMEEKNTTIMIPANRYDQVMKSISNSSDHILAFAGNFSQQADSHLVCIQDTQGNDNCYSTHAINIHNKPRKITGASFIVFNGALKTSSGLTAKSNIVEDGLMIQVLPEHMQQIRDNLRAMKNHTIPCGCVNAATDETVNIVWGENDVNFNVGVISAIDNTPLSGVPSIRVHNAKNHICANGSRVIRWTEVFIIQNGEDNPKNQDSVDISRVSESIAKATCDALVKYLDLLVANSCQKIGIRTTLHVDNVSYLAGSNGSKLPPIYMKSLDNELIPVLHRITTNNLGEHSIILELVFRILNL